MHRDNPWLLEQPNPLDPYVSTPLLTPWFLPRRLQPPLRLQPWPVFVLFGDGEHLRMIRGGDATIFINVIVADLEIAAAQFGGDVQQVWESLAAPTVAHMKVKTAPMVVLDEMAVWRVRTLVRLEYRRWMHAAVEAAHLISSFTEIFGNELIEARQRLGFVAALESLDVTSFDKNINRLFERTRHADVARPDDTDFIDDADTFGIARPYR